MRTGRYSQQPASLNRCSQPPPPLVRAWRCCALAVRSYSNAATKNLTLRQMQSQQSSAIAQAAALIAENPDREMVRTPSVSAACAPSAPVASRSRHWSLSATTSERPAGRPRPFGRGFRPGRAFRCALASPPTRALPTQRRTGPPRRIHRRCRWATSLSRPCCDSPCCGTKRCALSENTGD